MELLCDSFEPQPLPVEVPEGSFPTMWKLFFNRLFGFAFDGQFFFDVLRLLRLFRFLGRFQTDLELLLDIFRFAFDFKRFKFECGATFNVLYGCRFLSFQLNRFLDIFHLVRRFYDFLQSQSGEFFRSTRFPGCRIPPRRLPLTLAAFSWVAGWTRVTESSTSSLTIFFFFLTVFLVTMTSSDVWDSSSWTRGFNFYSTSSGFRQLGIHFVGEEDRRLGKFDDQVF